MKSKFTEEERTERARASRKKWYKNNKEKDRASSRRWRKKNKEKMAAAVRNWRKNNPEKAKALRKKHKSTRKKHYSAYDEKYRKKNKNKINKNFKKIYRKRWEDLHPLYIKNLLRSAGLKTSQITPKLIEIKRCEVILFREFKKAKEIIDGNVTASN
jgi:hypothetical protein